MVQTFEEFCGSPFINETLLLENTYPEFTDCFQNTVLVWVPCGFLWLLSPLYIRYLVGKEDASTLPLSIKNVAKSFMALLLFFLTVVDLLYTANSDKDGQSEVYTAVFVAYSIKAATFLLATLLIQLERLKGEITSGILFLFWVFLGVAGVVPFYTLIEKETYETDVFKFSMFFLYYTLVLFELVLTGFAEKEQRRPGYTAIGRPPCPEVTASFPSRISFNWITDLVITTYRTGVKEDTLWELNPRDHSSRVVPQLEKAWEDEIEKWKNSEKGKNLRPQVRYRANGDRNSEASPLLSDTKGKVSVKVDTEESNKKGPSLFMVLVRTYAPAMLKGWACKLVYDVLQFASPLVLNELIAYVETKNAPMAGPVYTWKGYVFALALFLVAFVQSCFFHQNFHIAMTCGMRIKMGLIAAVYKKALTMTSEARKSATVGEIVNLMSVDCQRIQDISGYLWMLWSAPVQIILALVLLWNTLGVSVLSGVAILVLMMPLNAFLAMKQRKYQVAQMKFKDARIKLMNEVLNGIKVLKLYAWEPSFEQKVIEIREKELDVLKKAAYLGATSSFFWTSVPFLVTLVTFATYILMSSDNQLDAQKAFVSLSLFNILRFPINTLPMIISYIVQGQVSIERIGKFLQSEDLDPTNVTHTDLSDKALSISNGEFSWDKTMEPALKDINLEVEDGKLIAVVGQVGAGKSSLVSALLGEMEKLKGRVTIKGQVAYVPQQAWIQNATVRDNILFGKDQDQRKYDQVIEACALGPDLEILQGGDLTEIGEKGINLSGGQKQRVSLARAVYNNADVYFLDDPLSAVDSHVGKHIFNKVVGSKGLLRNKTRVLVTHGVHWLPMVDTIVVMTDGKISEMGSYEELLSHDGVFAQFLKTYLTQENDDDDDPEVQQIKSRMLERVDSVTSGTETTGVSGEEDAPTRLRKSSRKSSESGGKPPLVRSISTMDRKDGAGKGEWTEKKDVKEIDKLIEAEKSEQGNVSWKVYINYFVAIGGISTFLIFGFFIIYQAAGIYSSIWLSQWTDDPYLKNISNSNTTEYQNKNYMYLGVYGALGITQAIVILIYSLLAAVRMVRAAGILHGRMLHNILKLPMSFFDTTPLGRIVNRFSRDVETIDNNLPQVLRMWMSTFFGALSVFVVISYSTPIFLSIIIPMGFLYYLVQRFYIPTSRQLKRVESTTRSPIYSHFGESITGASTIRGYGLQTAFVDQNRHKMDTNLVFYFAGIASNRWLGFRLELLGNLIVFAAAIFAVVTPDNTGGLVGLSISYALQVTSVLNFMVRMTSDLETNIVSVERVKEYSETATEVTAGLSCLVKNTSGLETQHISVERVVEYARKKREVTASLNFLVRNTSDLETQQISVERLVEYARAKREAEWVLHFHRPPRDWPTAGNVIFQDYQTRYREGLDLVLKGITCDIKGGERVGIVGRTGAGKSSLTVALFRLIEGTGGSIIIDGERISDMGLHDLRSKLTILPQDPVLFSGPLRMNLDPFNKFPDHKIWQVLEHSHLKTFVEGLPDGLEHECGEGGQNLSVGQRQLVCLARTLLRKTKILVLDEATAAVDMETDDLIQDTIREEFRGCTVLTIAHRLNTIMDYDKIMVLDQGMVREFESPGTLLKDTKSIFYGMAKDANLV